MGTWQTDDIDLTVFRHEILTGICDCPVWFSLSRTVVAISSHAAEWSTTIAMTIEMAATILSRRRR